MTLVNTADSLERQNEKLLVIAESLMRRVEQKNEQSGFAYRQFERAALLETQVRERTRDLERTLDLLQEANAHLEDARSETEQARSNLTEAIEAIDEGFALFDMNDRLVLFNSRFCEELADVLPCLRAGLAFGEYVQLVCESASLSLPSGEDPKTWASRRMAKHLEPHVVFNVRLVRDRWLQVSEHRTLRGGTVILQTDVSEIMQIERLERDKLRDQQAKMLQATLDHLNQGVCIFDNMRRLVGWNSKMNELLTRPEPAIELGTDFDSLLGRLHDLVKFPKSFNAERFVAWTQRPLSRKPVAFEIERKDNRIFSVFAREMPDRGFVISFTDVTAEREAARVMFEMNERLEKRVQERTEELGVALAEAERANASKSRFVAAASHDLLQPLSAAKLFVNSLADKTESDEARSIIAKTEQALSGAHQIIDALLDISKLDAGKAVFKKQSVRLSDIIRPLHDELRHDAAKKGVQLRVVDTDITVQSDPSYLRRILQNLLSNALRYTDTGRVLLGVRRSGGSARIEVWDTGRGIPEDAQASIFQEFKRLDPNHSDGGLGLGLAIVERACAGLGHELGLWSQPGTGSCFSLNVPMVSSEKPMSLEALLHAAPETHDLNGMLLLLVENDVAFASALSMVLEDLGCEIMVTHSAQEALDLMEAIQLVPDGFLIDYQLGDNMDGLDLVAHLRRLYGDVYCAMVSANKTRDLRQSCGAMGLPLLQKPVDRKNLHELLSRRALELYQRL
ncbi:MAG: PAS-domain containing protein [Roseobacter sp.]